MGTECRGSQYGRPRSTDDGRFPANFLYGWVRTGTECRGNPWSGPENKDFRSAFLLRCRSRFTYPPFSSVFIRTNPYLKSGSCEKSAGSRELIVRMGTDWYGVPRESMISPEQGFSFYLFTQVPLHFYVTSAFLRSNPFPSVPIRFFQKNPLFFRFPPCIFRKSVYNISCNDNMILDVIF